MAINAVGISLSDPGAVPGASTISPLQLIDISGLLMGAN